MSKNKIKVHRACNDDNKYKIIISKEIPGKYTDPVGNLLKDDAKKIFDLLDKKLPIGTWDELKLLFNGKE